MPPRKRRDSKPLKYKPKKHHQTKKKDKTNSWETRFFKKLKKL